jgi:hypothetical protein
MAKSIGIDENKIDVLKLLKNQMMSQKHNFQFSDNKDNHDYNDY